MTPREIFANLAYTEKLRSDRTAELLQIQAVGAQGDEKQIKSLLAELTDFEPA